MIQESVVFSEHQTNITEDSSWAPTYHKIMPNPQVAQPGSPLSECSCVLSPTGTLETSSDLLSPPTVATSSSCAAEDVPSQMTLDDSTHSSTSSQESFSLRCIPQLRKSVLDEFPGKQFHSVENDSDEEVQLAVRTNNSNGGWDPFDEPMPPRLSGSVTLPAEILKRIAVSVAEAKENRRRRTSIVTMKTKEKNSGSGSGDTKKKLLSTEQSKPDTSSMGGGSTTAATQDGRPHQGYGDAPDSQGGRAAVGAQPSTERESGNNVTTSRPQPGAVVTPGGGTIHNESPTSKHNVIIIEGGPNNINNNVPLAPHSAVLPPPRGDPESPKPAVVELVVSHPSESSSSPPNTKKIKTETKTAVPKTSSKSRTVAPAAIKPAVHPKSPVKQIEVVKKLTTTPGNKIPPVDPESVSRGVPRRSEMTTTSHPPKLPVLPKKDLSESTVRSSPQDPGVVPCVSDTRVWSPSTASSCASPLATIGSANIIQTSASPSSRTTGGGGGSNTATNPLASPPRNEGSSTYHSVAGVSSRDSSSRGAGGGVSSFVSSPYVTDFLKSSQSVRPPPQLSMTVSSNRNGIYPADQHQVSLGMAGSKRHKITTPPLEGPRVTPQQNFHQQTHSPSSGRGMTTHRPTETNENLDNPQPDVGEGVGGILQSRSSTGCFSFKAPSSSSTKKKSTPTRLGPHCRTVGVRDNMCPIGPSCFLPQSVTEASGGGVSRSGFVSSTSLSSPTSMVAPQQQYPPVDVHSPYRGVKRMAMMQVVSSSQAFSSTSTNNKGPSPSSSPSSVSMYTCSSSVSPSMMISRKPLSTVTSRKAGEQWLNGSPLTSSTNAEGYSPTCEYLPSTHSNSCSPVLRPIDHPQQVFHQQLPQRMQTITTTLGQSTTTTTTTSRQQQALTSLERRFTGYNIQSSLTGAQAASYARTCRFASSSAEAPPPVFEGDHRQRSLQYDASVSSYAPTSSYLAWTVLQQPRSPPVRPQRTAASSARPPPLVYCKLPKRMNISWELQSRVAPSMSYQEAYVHHAHQSAFKSSNPPASATTVPRVV